MRAFKALLLRSIGQVIGLIDFLSFCLILCLVGPPLLTRLAPPKPGETYGVVEVADRLINALFGPLALFVRKYLPHKAGDWDLTPFILAAFLFVLCYLCTSILRQLRVAGYEMEELEKRQEQDEAARGVQERQALLEDADPNDREKILELYTKTKKILESQRRDVAFLSIDVCNSTGMKEGEDPAVCERDFLQYRKLVEAAMAKHGALKAAWTPDGVMICFPALDAAAGAAQDLLRSLPAFNTQVKAMKTDFRLRCGMHAGAVIYDQAQPMEQMADAAIDLTGHLQKYADPDTILASKSLIDARGARLGFSPIDRKVDGQDVCAWKA